jgi:hypothetical protein
MPKEIDRETLEGSVADLPLWADSDAFSILQKICLKHSIPLDVLTELVVLQRERQHQARAAGIYMRFEEILGRFD